jgi:HAD superfamily hydrolase (TIGR01509 family)
MNKTTLSCVIFDIDGTLTRTGDLIFLSFNHVASKYLGRTFPPEEIVRLFGPPEEGALAVMFGKENVPAAMDDLCSFYREHHAAMASVHPGIEEILQFLRGRKVPLAVFTGKGSRTTSITLQGLGLARYFDLIVSGNDVLRHKPDPEGIRKILQAFRVNPGNALMVGDSVGDIKASRAAGVPVASVLWDVADPGRVLQASPDIVFRKTGEMLEWFRTRVN